MREREAARDGGEAPRVGRRRREGAPLRERDAARARATATHRVWARRHAERRQALQRGLGPPLHRVVVEQVLLRGQVRPAGEVERIVRVEAPPACGRGNKQTRETSLEMKRAERTPHRAEGALGFRRTARRRRWGWRRRRRGGGRRARRRRRRRRWPRRGRRRGRWEVQVVIVPVVVAADVPRAVEPILYNLEISCGRGEPHVDGRHFRLRLK